MKIGIDLDGVVFNSEALWAVYGELYDYKELNKNSLIKRDEPRVQDKYQWNNEETQKYFDKYIDIDNFDFVPGAKEVINLLKQEGYELIAITARNDYCHGKEYALKKLQEAGISFDKMYFGEKDKLNTCLREKIDYMIDDNYHICKNLSNNGIKTLYFHSLGRVHLQNNKNIYEVYNWGEIYRYLLCHAKIHI